MEVHAMATLYRRPGRRSARGSRSYSPASSDDFAVDLTADGTYYWTGPAPAGWQILGVLKHNSFRYALLRTPSGAYRAGLFRDTFMLPQELIRPLVLQAQREQPAP
jgi:hypothetical protein